MVLTAVVVLLIGVPFAWADTARVGIYYDGSGSMTGFFQAESNGLISLNQKLYDVFSASHLPCDASVFVTRDGSTQAVALQTFLENPLWGSESRLDEALKMAVDSDIVVIVTDNVQDAGSVAEAGIRDFYGMLEFPSVQRVLLCPISCRFDGPLYFYKNQHPDFDYLLGQLKEQNPDADFVKYPRSSDTYQIITMQGPRAMAVYVIFKASLTDDRIEEMINRLHRKVEVPPLVVKPIDQGNIIIKGIMDKKAIEKSITSFASLCGESPDKAKAIIRPPNLELLSTEENIFRAAAGKDARELTLSPMRGFTVPYLVDKKKEYRFYSCVSNKSPTLVLGKRGMPCSTKITMSLQQVGFSVPADYKSCFIKPSPVDLADTIPNYLPSAMFSAELLGKTDSPFVALHNIAIPAFQMDLTWSEPFQSLYTLFRLSASRYLPLTIKGTFQIDVPPGYFSVNPAYNEKYFTDSVFNQRQIYTPEDIISYIHNKPTQLTCKFSTKDIYLEVPWWVRFTVFSSLGVIIICLLLLLFGSMRHVTLVFNDKKRKPLYIHLPIPFSKGVYQPEGTAVLIVRKKWLGYIASPGEGYQLIRQEDHTAISHVKLPSDLSFSISGPGMENVLVQPFADKNAGHDTPDRLEKPDGKRSKSKKTEVDDDIFDQGGKS